MPQILVSEVGPRDGLQSIAAVMSTPVSYTHLTLPTTPYV